MPWRTIEGETLAPATMPQLEVLLRGVFDKRRFLDLIRHFIVFDDDARRDLRARGVESPDRADALIGAIILGQESQIDWKAALAFQKEIKHRMHLDYLRTGRGRPHIDW